jgi:hypothetical protein
MIYADEGVPIKIRDTYYGAKMGRGDWVTSK